MMKQRGTTMFDFEKRIQKIKRSFEKDYSSMMRNTSWHMSRETKQELEDELYQQYVNEYSDGYIDYLMICFW